MKSKRTVFDIVCVLAPVFLVYAAFLVIAYSYIRYYSFDYQITNNITPGRGFLLVLGLLVAFLILYTHILAMCTDPGQVDQNILKIYRIGCSLESCSGDLYCDKCRQNRPERSHHCKKCDRCILKMDHHCPWIANCVGLRNQKYFILFLLYTIIGLGLAFMGLVNKFILLGSRIKALMEWTLNMNKFTNINNTNQTTNTTTTQINEFPIKLDDYPNPLIDPLFITLSTVLSFVLFVFLLILFVIQMYYVCNNMTTIEYNKYKQKEKSPYYRNSYILNIKIVFGQNPFLWLVPLFYLPKQNNGYYFIKKEDTP